MGLADETSKHLCQEDTLERKDISNSETNNSYPELYEALDHERELYRDLASALPLGVYRLRVFHDVGTREDRWNSTDNAPYKIEFVNDRINDILGIDKATYIRNPGIINHHIFEDDMPEFIRKNVEANSYTIPFMWEGRFIRNGTLIWVHFESRPRVLDNKDILWTGFFEDISERKKAEEKLQQKNGELQLMNAEKDKFFTIIAHDLKSPFNSILGFSGLLMDKLDQKDTESVREYCEIIRNSSQQAMNLLHNLMLWSQSQTGRMSFNPEYIDLMELMDENVQLYESIAAQKSIQISKETSDAITIYADKAMIGTVIRNLVSNAIKFTPKGGNIHILTYAMPDKITITVSDSGVGMTQAEIDNLFHIDSSFTSPDTNGEKGTGLGLLLCKEFIEKHKGFISIKSDQGKGSVFRVEIPMNSGK